jgi:hypothetical protein
MEGFGAEASVAGINPEAMGERIKEDALRSSSVQSRPETSRATGNPKNQNRRLLDGLRTPEVLKTNISLQLGCRIVKGEKSWKI